MFLWIFWLVTMIWAASDGFDLSKSGSLSIIYEITTMLCLFCSIEILSLHIFQAFVLPEMNSSFTLYFGKNLCDLSSLISLIPPSVSIPP